MNKMEEWLFGTKECPGHLKRKSLSIERFANLVGVNRATIYYFIAGKNNPSKATLEKICQVLNVPIEEGLKWVQPSEPGGVKGRQGPKFRGGTNKELKKTRDSARILLKHPICNGYILRDKENDSHYCSQCSKRVKIIIETLG